MLLSVDRINAYYGLSHVLQDVSFEVDQGEVVCLLGRNGAGKTTTLKSIVGVVRVCGGRVRFKDEDITALPTHQIAGRNVCLVPEDRGVFRVLTVEENLKLAAQKGSRWSLDDIYAMFPRLKERRHNGGGHLSGGEQQMLSIGRALMNSPELLILDEPTEGLAPVIVDEIVAQLHTIRQSGIAILLVEQNLEVCMELASRHYILESGQIVYHADNEAFKADETVRDRYLSVGV
ncbi:MAG: ABC transporter ATP-binding protein [Castellaniella sp.]|uniref:ABC transporter ATP-binding protein n=1 Tax=Castellaniella sp. TaxID=1955812 RepID=UPI0012111F5C|nr:ABC transporter ATP-binding protein [Castellaniella sp.]TAN29095.1 MAG: ABC transporter ATP-binding protein [Castellaniella sp.]